MKLNKISFAVATAAIMLVTSCNKIKDFDDTNIDPNTTAVPSTAALLSNVEAGLGGFASNTNAGLYAQQFSETQYTEVSLYALPKLNFDGIYAAGLMDLQNIININTDPATAASVVKFGANANQIATARILKAYIFWTITDRWGDIPYFEALKGDANLMPKYDKQEDIYKDLIKELKEASAQFNENGAAVTGDLVYEGDIASWKKFANSLRMLIALRTSKVYPNPGEWAATEFNAAFTDPAGYIGDNSDNFTLNYPGNVAAFRNPFYNLYNGRTDFAESKFFADLLLGFGDPRQPAFGSSNTGFPYGLTRDAAVSFANNNSTYARILAAGYRAADAPLTVIGASDVLLAIAEAAQRGWISADVAAFYSQGIAANWAEWKVSGNVANYIANNDGVNLSSGNALAKIQLQQYISWYPDGIQAWANWRRTGVPALAPTPNALNNGQIPRRFVYGTNEYAVNQANVTEAAGRIAGGDVETARVWWDK